MEFHCKAQDTASIIQHPWQVLNTVLLTLFDLLRALPRDGKWVEREDVVACRHSFLLLSAEIYLVLSLCLDRFCLYFQRTGTF